VVVLVRVAASHTRQIPLVQSQGLGRRRRPPEARADPGIIVSSRSPTRSNRPPSPAPRPTAAQHLTDRELVALRFLASHLRLPEAASELSGPRNPIKTQVAAVYRKLGASWRSEAVELGLVGSTR
jgi:LuxR family maltose regulon positive regulatory protein